MLKSAQNCFVRFFTLFQPNTSSLYSPAGDFLLAGGISVALYVFFQFFVDGTVDMPSWAMALYVASFFVNFPHFIASYQLFYGDSRSQFFDFHKHPFYTLRVWFAGVVVPVLMCTYVVIAFSAQSATMFGYFILAMYFFVGWHYIKQVYGCVIVLSLAKGVHYLRHEQWILLAPLYTLWALFFIQMFLEYDGVREYSGLAYDLGWAFSDTALRMALFVLAVSTLVLIGMLIRKYKTTGAFPPISAVVALLSIYLWYLPFSTNFNYIFVIPLLHSLQYQLFVLSYERNKALQSSVVSGGAVAKKTGSQLQILGYVLMLTLPIVVIVAMLPVESNINLRRALSGITNDVFSGNCAPTIYLILAVFGLLTAFIVTCRQFMNRHTFAFLKFFTISVLFGFLAFGLIPNLLDVLSNFDKLPSVLQYDAELLGYSLFGLIISVFINIHHYFIDNVLWKRENPNVSTYLFNKPKSHS